MRLKNKLIWLAIFSLAMGFMETAVVVYLRKIYYPGGFRFPLIPIDPGIALTEFLREAATITMLVGIGIITGKTRTQRFAFFIYCFAIWDLFYYVFLKILLNWPDSLFTWDILFLIPVPWVGPVLAPCLVSSTLFLLSLMVMHAVKKGKNESIQNLEWQLLILGCLVIIYSFILDYLQHLFGNASGNMWTLFGDEALFREFETHVPFRYNWVLFCVGEGILIWMMLRYFLRVIWKRDEP